MFDITDLSSFQELQALLDNVFRVKAKSRVPIIVVGQKCDLDHEREVSIALGKHKGDNIYTRKVRTLRELIKASMWKHLLKIT